MAPEAPKSRAMIQIAFASLTEARLTALKIKLRALLAEFPPSNVHTRTMDSFGAPEAEPAAPPEPG